ncbi:hypothetical protein [Caldisphaera lagunensis]|nr:hypothetical protein [Caldisphaera lagunensis]
MYDKEFAEKISEWKEIEENHSKSHKETMDKVKSPILRLILTVISLDSYKHSLIYEIIEDTIKENKYNILLKEESEEVLKELKNHIMEEREAIKFLTNFLNSNNDFVRFALKLIYKDELLHHVLLHDAFNALINSNDESFKELYESIDKWLKCDG